MVLDSGVGAPCRITVNTSNAQSQLHDDFAAPSNEQIGKDATIGSYGGFGWRLQGSMLTSSIFGSKVIM